MKPRTRLWLALPVVAAALGCAQRRPVLYPNDHLRSVGNEAAARDIDECLVLAHQSGHEQKPAETVAKNTAGGAVAGAAVGTAVGAVLGNYGRGAGAGAAGGGTRGLLRGMRASRNPDPIERRFVEECLAERGYKPIGWR
jgi:hypothetical protein